MIAVFWLALCVLSTGAPSARWTATPARARIGEPVEWKLEIRAPLSSDVLLPDKDPPLDPSWLVLEPRRVERAEREGERVIDLVWSLASLEPGKRTPFVFDVPVEAPAGRVMLTPASAELDVLGELGANEDAPRPEKGFLPLPPEAPSRVWIAWTVLGLLAACGVAIPLAIRWRRRAALRRRVPPPTALEELAALERAFAAEEARGRETVFALTHLVRERTDAFLKQPRAALPDEEWIRVVAGDAGLSAPARAAAQRLLERADAVKYAQATPSRFLVEELCADARAALATEELAA
ncbi:MAG: hypothetical protein IPJ19_00710 [Planctomycetes bacterium]|nr:hypothetical protein [Planctomycetota bacterium]